MDNELFFRPQYETQVYHNCCIYNSTTFFQIKKINYGENDWSKFTLPF